MRRRWKHALAGRSRDGSARRNEWGERGEERGQWSHTAAGVGVAEALIASAETSLSSPSKADPESRDHRHPSEVWRQELGSRDSEKQTAAGDSRVQAHAAKGLAEMESAAESLLGVLRRR